MIDTYEFATIIPNNWYAATDRYLRQLRNPSYQPSIRTQAEWERRFSRTLKENDCTVPWSIEAIYQSIEIRTRIKLKMTVPEYVRIFEAAIKLCLKTLEDDSITFEDRWDRLLIGYNFLLRFQFMEKPTVEENEKRRKYLKYWDLVSTELTNGLSHIDREWAEIMKFRIIQNIIGIRWNACEREKRAERTMEDQLIKLDAWNAFHRYNELVPRQIQTPLSELAIASRMKKRERYPDILRRLKVADARITQSKHVILAFFASPDFDDDYDDFRAWLQDAEP